MTETREMDTDANRQGRRIKIRRPGPLIHKKSVLQGIKDDLEEDQKNFLFEHPMSDKRRRTLNVLVAFGLALIVLGFILLVFVGGLPYTVLAIGIGCILIVICILMSFDFVFLSEYYPPMPPS